MSKLSSLGVTLILAAKPPALGIGLKSNLPWNLKNDMKFFRQATRNSTVIMGRKTWESIPEPYRPLKNRANIIVSSKMATTDNNNNDELVHSVNSFTDALDLSKNRYPDRQIFVIGGGQLYSTALKHPDTRYILLTEISDPENQIDCDTFFSGEGFTWYPIGENPPQNTDWIRKDFSDLKEFLGSNASIELPVQPVVENGLSYTFNLWEKTNKEINR